MGAAEAAAELEHRDPLPAAVEAAREVVQLGDARRREGGLAGLVGARPRDGATVRGRLRPVVEAEHPLDRRRDRGRHVEVARASAVVALRRAVVRETRGERVLHPRRWSHEDDAAPRRARLADVQSMRPCELLDRGEVLVVGAVAGGELAPREVAAFPERLASELVRRRQRLARTHDHRHLDRLVGRDRADPVCSRQRPAGAAADSLPTCRRRALPRRVLRCRVPRCPCSSMPCSSMPCSSIPCSSIPCSSSPSPPWVSSLISSSLSAEFSESIRRRESLQAAPGWRSLPLPRRSAAHR